MQFSPRVVNNCLCQKDKYSSIQKSQKKQLKIKHLHGRVFDYFANAAVVLKKWQCVLPCGYFLLQRGQIFILSLAGFLFS
jgi:hypothetical protein